MYIFATILLFLIFILRIIIQIGVIAIAIRIAKN
jgi:hypothetical protein